MPVINIMTFIYTNFSVLVKIPINRSETQIKAARYSFLKNGSLDPYF